MRYLVPALFFCLFSALPAAHAHAEAPKYAEARLFSPVTATGSGDAVQIGLELKLKPKWDTYWRSPGDAGLPPDLDWKGSANLKAYSLQYPSPHRLTVSGLDNNVYTDEVVFPITVTLENPGQPLDLHLKLGLLVCNEICVPEKHELTLSLPAGAAEKSADAGLYEAALKKLPKQQMEGYGFSRAWLETDAVTGKTLLAIEGDLAVKPTPEADLFIEHDSGTVFGRPAISYDEKTGKAAFRVDPHTNDAPEKLAKDLATGDLTLTFVDGDTAYEGKTSVGMSPDTQPAPLAAPAKLKEKVTSIDLSIILAALLGGLILNLMPCVLPVLSLKVLSVVSHGGKDNRRTIFTNFMASALGIVASFWLMGIALIALKAAGGSIGWGIQFQHPGFLVFLIVVVLGFAANMWGLFEIPLPRFIARHAGKRHEMEPTPAGHFLTGMFATLLATPCSAPFLGTAISFALARGAYEILTIFTFVGLGLAAPYILLALSPRLFRYMPKPGRWMIGLRRVLALALVATAVWLGSVLMSVTATPAFDAGWTKFDEKLIAPAVADGKTVIVDITADWCLTCKANKKFVLGQQEVIDALNAPNVVRLQGDLTMPDPAIDTYLHSFGRYGIPFNIVYGPGLPEGKPLPELLTKDDVMDALSEAAGE
ncbi:MAG TPA: protein-disulfide reductase DsbD domain-containing protein [Patescibacteria group bacterium]|nr:protein-disulfide reductase DsbD domain-containing protein [Patescibacteria group bacterium]